MGRASRPRSPSDGGLGVVAAYAVAGNDFGQLPVLTVPVGLLGALLLAVVPFAKASTRLKILLAGDVAFLALAWLSR